MFTERETECWNCGERIKVYTWPEHELWPDNCPEQDRPATLRLIHSSMAGGVYWANVCSACDRIQGDWFLYCEPDGAFCFALNEATEESS